MLKNSALGDDFCSNIWTKSIKGKRTGPEKIGLEMEFFAYDSKNYSPLGEQNCALDIQTLLKNILNCADASEAHYDEMTKLITTVFLKNGGNFSVEPGGQLEYSSAPFEALEDLMRNVQEGLKILEHSSDNKLIFFSHGTNPIAKSNHPLVLPKERYQIMTRYFESAPKDIRGIDMMRHSATVQANLDVFGDSDWQNAVDLTLTLIPITKNMFANSKFFKNQKSLYASERQDIWNHMEPARSGIPTNLPFAENSECEYAKWAKKANVFFVNKLPLGEQPLYGELTFERWLQHGYKGIYPQEDDWETHLGTLFPHLRLRDFLEIRHIDAQPFEHTLAPVAFFSYLLSNQKVRNEVFHILKNNHIDIQQVFGTEQGYDFIYNPLLNFVLELAEKNKDCTTVKSLSAYKDFLKIKNDYWNESNAFEFVKKYAVKSPAQEFVKNIL